MSRYLSRDELESIAERVFRAYRRLPQLRGADPLLCVDPTLLLEKLLRLEIAYRHLSPDGRTLGVTAYEEVGIEIFDGEGELFFFDGRTVLVEEYLLAEGQTGRRHFTLAHEGSHHVLKMLFPQDYGTGVNARRVLRYRGTGRSRDREEWQADRLASAILMPRELVEQAMWFTGLRDRIGMLNAVWRRREYECFCNMCALLGVSKQALCIRMKALGLLVEEHLRFPNEILDIDMEENEHD